MTIWRGVVTRVQGFMTSSQLSSFISVYLSWVRRGNAGMYKASGGSRLVVFIVVQFIDLCLFCFAYILDVAHTLYTHGTNAKKSHDRVILT